MDSIAIGRLIRTTRQSLGMRQDELASVANLSTRSLSNIENGKATAQLSLVLNTLSVLGIKITLTPPADSGTQSISDL